MPAGIWSLEYLNQNSQRRFPLAESADGIDVTGSFMLPTSFLLELDLPVSAGMNVDPSRFFLATVTSLATGFSLIIGYQPVSGDPVNAATALIPLSAHVPGETYTLGGIGSFADTVGKVVIGRLDDINLQPSGSFNLGYSSGAIDPDCVRPIIRGVTSISVSNGSEVSNPLFGDIVLVANQNIQLSTVIVSGQSPQILISAVSGEGLIQDCVCAGQASTPISQINGIGPTNDGKFYINGSTCLQVQPATNGVTIVDVCSEPCCGCQELEAITADLERFAEAEATLQNFLNQLQAQVTTTNQVILGSKLSDQGCNSCT